MYPIYYKLLAALILLFAAVPLFHFIKAEAAKFKRIQTTTGEPIITKQMGVVLFILAGIVTIVAIIKLY